MNSRMEKYYESDSEIPKRTEKNALLYKEINKSDIDKFKLNSNISVLENNNTSIDIEELKDILDKKYTNPPQRKSIFIEPEEENFSETKETTKEYDINAILEKAREEKEEDYEADRFKKISETQLDILKSLTIPEKEEKEKTPEQEELMSLINTISAKELESTKKLNPLDILSDLKGGENTEVIEPINETRVIDNSFYTNSVNITKKDLEENEFIEEKEASKNPLVWILIVIAIIAFLAGLVIIVNKYFNLGLF